MMWWIDKFVFIRPILINVERKKTTKYRTRHTSIWGYNYNYDINFRYRKWTVKKGNNDKISINNSHAINIVTEADDAYTINN